MKSLEMYILIFFTYSFLGWLMESVGSIFKEKKFVNRGFLIGPYCPVYGTGIVLISFLLKKYTNDIPVLFFLSILICGILEYATSYFMEKLFNARWWDYSKKKFNINGRICLETLIPFGVAGTTIICVVNPFFVNIYSMLPEIALKIIAYSLSAMYIIDSIVSFKIISSFKKETYQQPDSTEEISNMVKDKAEDMFMKAESDVIVFTRRLRLKKLKMERKIQYTRRKIYSDLKTNPKELAGKFYESKKQLDQKIQKSKELVSTKVQVAKNTIEEKQKLSKEDLEYKIQNLKLSSEELTNHVKERFKNKSLLKSRLMDAFPSLKITSKEIFKEEKDEE